jgi:hypothetical protein
MLTFLNTKRWGGVEIALEGSEERCAGDRRIDLMPGTMHNMVLPILEENTGRKCGQGFYLGTAPNV